MTRLIAALVLLFASVAQADPFARYFDHGVESYAKNFRSNCITDLKPGTTAVERLAAELMLSPAATADFVRRLGIALDQINAEGVIITGTRRHRIFAGDLQIELKVILKPDEPRFENPNLRMHMAMVKQDLVENSVFLKHFGAREFQRATGVYVVASRMDISPEQIPFAEDIGALREQLTRDLIELQNVHRRYDILSAQNIFGKLATSGCGGSTLEEFVKICLPQAFGRVFSTIKGGTLFSAGAETTVVFKNDAPTRKAWMATLREHGYRDGYTITSKNILNSALSKKRPRAKEKKSPARIQPSVIHH